MRNLISLSSAIVMAIFVICYVFTQNGGIQKEVTQFASSEADEENSSTFDANVPIGALTGSGRAASAVVLDEPETSSGQSLSIRKISSVEWDRVAREKNLEIRRDKIFIKNPFPVRVDLEQFDAARDRLVGDIKFDLGTGETVVGRIGRVVERGERDYTLQGKIPGEELSSFTLSIYNDVAVGAFRGDKIGLRELRYVGDGVHKVQELEPHLMPGCSVLESTTGGAAIQGAVDSATKAAADQAQASEYSIAVRGETASFDVAAAPTATELDVLIAYSASARQSEGGTNAMLALLNLAVDDANASLINSQIEASIRVVHTVEVIYGGTLGTDALDEITNPSDGVLDNLHTLRNTYDADFVAFVTYVTDVCGIAWLMNNLSVSFQSNAFSVTSSDCLSNNTFAHELGHNFGSTHAIGDGASGGDPGTTRGEGLHNYSHGARWNSSGGTQYRSTMAYSPGVRALYFSNPNVFYLGGRTGVSNSEDNARSITNAKSTLAQFRVSSNPDDHGDSTSDSTAVSLGDVVSGNIEVIGDVDMFSIVLGTHADLTFSSTGGTNTFGRLLNASGNAVRSNDNGGAGTNFEITYSASPGTYYLEVGSSLDDTGAYTVSFAGVSDDHGDDAPSATQISPSSTTGGQLELAGDDDFFRIIIPSLTYLDVSSAGGIDTFGSILNSSGTILESDTSDGPGNNFRIVRQLSPGIYYVRVRGATGSETGAYTLVAALTDGSDDHGNIFADATVVSPGSVAVPSSTASEIELGGDTDFFRFVLPGPYPFNVRIASAGTTDTLGELYDSNFSPLRSEDDGGASGNFQIDHELVPGTYYVKVTGFNSIETGVYEMILGADPIIPPSEPASNLSATSAFSNRIELSWTAGLHASSYKVYRSSNDNTGAAVLVAENVASTSYSDFSAPAGEASFYWVQSSNITEDSAWTVSAEGYRILLPPTITGQPGNRTIEEGSTLNISVNATTDAGSLTYQWYEGIAPDSLTPVGSNSRTLSLTNFSGDNSFWVRITNATGPTDSRTAIVTVIPARPTDVDALTVVSGIQLSWTAAANVSVYEVYRSLTNSVIDGERIATVTGGATSFVDTEAEANEVYYYFIRSSRNGRFSGYTTALKGTRELVPPAIVNASTTSFENVTIDWSFVNAATASFVFRGPSDSIGSARNIGSVPTPGTTFVDETAIPKEQYYYWIRGFNTTTGFSEYSDSVMGTRLGGPGVEIENPNDKAATPDATDLDTPEKFRSTFKGLVRDDSNTERVDGSITVSISKNTASVSLIYLDQPIRLKGPINADGSLEVTAVDANGDDLSIEIQLEVSAAGGIRMRGPLKINNSTRGEVLALSNGFNKKTNPASFASSYTALLSHEGVINSLNIPAGSGIGAGSISTGGTIKMGLTLADGAKVTASSFASVAGQIPIYGRPYGRGKKGQIAGILAVRDVPNISDFDGTLHWTRPAGETRPTIYTSGFDTIITALGSKFVRPVKGEKMLSQLSDAAENAMWSVEGGNLAPIPTNRGLNWSSRNRIVDASNTKTHSLSVKPNTKSGVVTASYVNKEIDPIQSLKMSGVVFQKQGFVAGHFAGNGESGLFVIESLDSPELKVTDVSGTPFSNGDSLDFGTVGIDGGTGSRVVVISNIGSGQLHLPAPPETSGDSAFYVVKKSSGYLSPGSSLAFRIGFNPDQINQVGEFTITSNDRLNSPFTLDLTGIGQVGDDSDNHENGIGDSQFSKPEDSAVDPERNAVGPDSLTHSGKFNGLIFPVEGQPSAVGYGFAAVSFNRRTGIGSVSITFNKNAVTGKFRGTIEPDGSVVGTLSSRLAATHTLTILNLVETLDGSSAFFGSLQEIASGELFEFTLARQSYSKTNLTPDVGVYTSILPMNESLGANFPGDGTGSISVAKTGSVKGRFYLGDGSAVSFSNVLTNASRASVYYSRRGVSLAGYLNFRDVPTISDFDGKLRWNKPGSSKTVDEGFTTEVSVIGSRFSYVKGEAALTGLAAEGVNTLGTIVSGWDPATSTTNIEIEPLEFNWSVANRLTYFIDNTEKAGLKFSTKNGLMSGTYRDIDGTFLLIRGAIFQKQNRVGGHFYSKKKDTFGYFYLLPEQN